jgi:hypothetical protein
VSSSFVLQNEPNSVEESTKPLVRLVRYETRAVSRRDAAIREIMKARLLAQSACLPEMQKHFVQNEPNFLKANQRRCQSHGGRRRPAH